MKMNLIKGSFEPSDALEMITKMIAVKIKFHEDCIRRDDTEEDVKMREARIRELQKELYEVRHFIEQQAHEVTIQAEIQIVPQYATAAAAV